MKPFRELFEALLAGDETLQIEAKLGGQAGRSALETICAYSNTPGIGGGYLLLGVKAAKTASGPSGFQYQVVGVENPDKLQSDLASQCSTSFNHVVRPEMRVSVEDGKATLVVYVPEVQANEKPLYFRKNGLPGGAYLRIGCSDHRFTDEDLERVYSLRTENGYDGTVINDCALSDLDAHAIRAYRLARRELNGNAPELKFNDLSLLKALGVVVEHGETISVTRAGLLIFGKKTALRRHCPSARVDVVEVVGTEWVQDPERRYRTREIREPLMLAVETIISTTAQALPKTFSLKGARPRRSELPAIPYAVLREAIVNAVMHRNYRVHQPTMILLFSDRLEIRNSGYSLVPESTFGEPGSRTRNPTIAAVLHETGLAEQKGSGIAAMRDQMRRANLTEPIFQSRRDEDRFEVVLFTHHLVDPASVTWLAQFGGFQLSQGDRKALVFARKVGYIDNASYRDLNGVDVLAASLSLRKMRDLGILEQHLRSSATYYTVAKDWSEIRHPKDKGGQSLELNPKERPLPVAISQSTLDLIKAIGHRGKPDLIELAIVRLCATAPMTVHELCRYLSRHPIYIRKKFLARLVKNKTLSYLYPGTLAHPRQAYVAPPMLAETPIPEGVIKKKRVKANQPSPSLFDEL